MIGSTYCTVPCWRTSISLVVVPKVRRTFALRSYCSVLGLAVSLKLRAVTSLMVSQSTVVASSTLGAVPLLLSNLIVRASPCSEKEIEGVSVSKVTSAELCVTATRFCSPPALTTTEALRSCPFSLRVALTLRVLPACSTESQASLVEKADQFSLLVVTVTVCSAPSLAKVRVWTERSRLGSSISFCVLQAGRASRRLGSRAGT